MDVSRNVVLITGGTSGIGFALAQELLRLDNVVLITGRDQARLDQARQKLPQVRTFQSDVTDAQAIARLRDVVVVEFPRLNVLVNNAGIMHKVNLHDSSKSLEDIPNEIETNLVGPMRMVEQFLPQLKAQPSAAIVNVSSGLAFVPLPIAPIYSATKAAIHSFTQSLRIQLKHTNVKVFELAPPWTQTPLLTDFETADVRGPRTMDVQTLVRDAIDGLRKDRLEIRPGSSNLLKLMSRVAPQFILKQLGKPVDAMLAQTSTG